MTLEDDPVATAHGSDFIWDCSLWQVQAANEIVETWVGAKGVE
jgi:hypothetical protein